MLSNRLKPFAGTSQILKTISPPLASLQFPNRSFVSQTLLSRTDFERKTVNELREELKKRGITTGAKNRTKSALISKILEDEQQRTNAIQVPCQARSISNKKDQRPGPMAIKISSPAPMVARVTDEVEKEIPVLTKIAKSEEMAETSSALGSPVSNERSKGHHAETWPASVNLPITPLQEIESTAVPFIPDNYASHLQTHAPEIKEVQGTSGALEFSTASHPSTLPEGGPTIGTGTKDEPLSSSNTENSEPFFSPLSGVMSQFQELKTSSHRDTKFEFEDRPLNGEERQGLYKLIGLLSFGWLMGGIFAPASPSQHRR
ncbi:hypothetical protein DFH28DRAFT_1096039 [Melampsora americana]|nr:hypothetical protein DFH28DRAFT_1096039 [Melampsora americana]